MRSQSPCQDAISVRQKLGHPTFGACSTLTKTIGDSSLHSTERGKAYIELKHRSLFSKV